MTGYGPKPKKKKTLLVQIQVWGRWERWKGYKGSFFLLYWYVSIKYYGLCNPNNHISKTFFEPWLTSTLRIPFPYRYNFWENFTLISEQKLLGLDLANQVLSIWEISQHLQLNSYCTFWIYNAVPKRVWNLHLTVLPVCIRSIHLC